MLFLLSTSSRPNNDKAWLHPLLWALWPALFIFAECQHAVPLWRLIRPAALLLLGTLAAEGILCWRAKNFPRRMLALSIIIIWFISLDYIRALLSCRYRVLLPPYFLLLLLILIGIARLQASSLRIFTATAFISALALVLPNLLRIGAYQIGLAGHTAAFLKTRPALPPAQLPLGYRPDIYYIILDSYTRSDVLKKRFMLDNSAFLEGLQERGFYVATQSNANYPFTDCSLPSALNMCYLQELGSQPLSVLLRHNRLCAFLHAQGYICVAFVSTTEWEMMDFFPADVRLAPPLPLSPFECAFFEKFWLKPYTPALQRGPVAMDYCRLHTLFALQQLPQVARAVQSNAPKFVFVHLLPPHFPFIFDSQGEDISRQVTQRLAAQRTQEEFQQIFRESYAAQATFISAQILKVVEAILAHAPQPPVIIIQGDHGARAQLWTTGARQWEDLFPILNAYYLPKGGQRLLWSNITPVNSFRVVLNHCFGTDLEMLPSRSYWWDRQRPNEFIPMPPPSPPHVSPPQNKQQKKP